MQMTANEIIKAINKALHTSRRKFFFSFCKFVYHFVINLLVFCQLDLVFSILLLIGVCVFFLKINKADIYVHFSMQPAVHNSISYLVLER